jgi:hypothetical protein
MERLKLIYGWLLETPASERDSYHSWLCLWRHIIFGLIFQYVRMCTTMTPIEARDRILIRLQKGYYPLRQDSAWLCLGIRALILARYSWLAAKMLFLELYFLNFLFWKSHDYVRRKDILPQLTKLFSLSQTCSTCTQSCVPSSPRNREDDRNNLVPMGKILSLSIIDLGGFYCGE